MIVEPSTAVSRPVVVTMTGHEARELVLALEAYAEIHRERVWDSCHAQRLERFAAAIDGVRIGETDRNVT